MAQLLVLNEDLEVVDENWVIDLRSPYVVAHIPLVEEAISELK